MRHATLAKASDKGVIGSISRFKTIGIYNDSISWGVWLPEKSHAPDLIVSAINPSSWPFTFRLTLRLRDSVGSMAAAAAELQRLGVNILSARSSVSGHHHATWNLIGEAVELREELEERGYSFSSYSNDDARDDLALGIARRLLSFLRKVSAGLDETKDDFLHPRFLAKQLLSFDEHQIGSEFWNDGEFRQAIGDQRSRAVSFAVLPVLMYLWRRGKTNLRGSDESGRSLQPLEFQYREPDGMLRASDARFESDLQFIGAAPPCVAAASFDTDEHFLRLRFFSEAERRRLCHIEMDYRQSFGDQVRSTGRGASERVASTKGLIGRFTDHIAGRDFNLVQVSNSIRKQNTGEEFGGLRFIATMSREPTLEDLRQAETSIQDALRTEVPGLDVRRLEMSVANLGDVFISRHEDTQRVEILEEVKALSRRYGFLPAEASTTTDGVTERAVREIKSCEGMIQVYGKRAKGDPRELQWLIGEYAAGFALGIPTIRLVDLDVRDEEEWKSVLRWSRDQPLHYYQSGWDLKQIRSFLGSRLPSFFDRIRERQRLRNGAGG